MINPGGYGGQPFGYGLDPYGDPSVPPLIGVGTSLIAAPSGSANADFGTGKNLSSSGSGATLVPGGSGKVLVGS